jgi:hypothetical protein
MSLTNYPNGVTSFGVPIFGAGGLIPVPGDIYFVDQVNGQDGRDGKSPETAKLTLSAVHTKMISGQNDTVIILGSTTTIGVRETETLAWSKDQCHIIGAMAHGRISQRVSIRAASGSDFTPLVNVTADGCVFANFHVFHGYDTAEDQIAWLESGERNAHINLHIFGMGDATPAERAGSRSLKLSGDGERYFENCTIGGDTVPRDGSAEIEFDAGAVRDWFEGCLILSYAKAGAGDNHMVRADGAGDIDRFVMFRNCTFLNTGSKSAGAAMDEAFDVHDSVGGAFIVQGCSFFGITDVEAATVSGNVLINTWAATAADDGVGTTTAAT